MKLILTVLLCLSTLKAINYYTYSKNQLTIEPAINAKVNASQTYKVSLNTPSSITNLTDRYRMIRIVYL